MQIPEPPLSEAIADTGHKEAGTWRDHVLAVSLAVLGGLIGILGAFIEEGKSLNPFLPFIVAPIVEEALKPAGVYFILGKYQRLLRSQLYTAFLCALAGVSFAVVENLVYLYIYIPQHSQSLVLYRFTVNVFVHSLTSFILGFGINQSLISSVKGEVPFLKGSKKFFVIAILIHAIYNTGAFIAQIAGLLNF